MAYQVSNRFGGSLILGQEAAILEHDSVFCKHHYSGEVLVEPFTWVHFLEIVYDEVGEFSGFFFSVVLEESVG